MRCFGEKIIEFLKGGGEQGEGNDPFSPSPPLLFMMEQDGW